MAYHNPCLSPNPAHAQAQVCREGDIWGRMASGARQEHESQLQAYAYFYHES